MIIVLTLSHGCWINLLRDSLIIYLNYLRIKV